LQAAAFFARWGSTPGETLTAGLIAVRERIPEIVEGEKEAKKVRMEINKSIASLDEATRLETIGEIDAAAAVKEKDAEKMQALFLKLSEYQMQTQKENAAQKRVETREDAAQERMEKQEELKGIRMQTLQDSVNATQLTAERIRRDATRASRAGQEATDMVGRVTAAAQLQANVEKIIETEMSKPAYAALVNRASMAETPEFLPMITAAKEQLAIRERNFDRMRKDAQDTVNFVREKAGMKPPATPSGGAGGKDRPPLTDPSLQK
jgi:CRISPR/Cas system-associated endoribonuclease Cas2